MDNPGLDSEPAYSRRYGKYSPVGVQCSDGLTRIEQMPEITPDDIALLDNFYTDFNVGGITDEQLERLKWLDKYLDLPTVQATLEKSFAALSRCIHSDCIIPDKYRNPNNFNKIGNFDFKDSKTLEWLIRCNNNEVLPGHETYHPLLDSFHITKLAEVGNLEILKIIHGIRPSIISNLKFDLIQHAANYNHIEILDWYYRLDRDCVISFIAKWLTGTTDVYKLETLQWMHSVGIPIGHFSTTQYENLDILKWMRSVGIQIDKKEIVSLVLLGNLDLLAKIHSAGMLNMDCELNCRFYNCGFDNCCMDPHCCNILAHNAIATNKIDILKWLFSNHLMQLNPLLMKTAIRYKDFDTIKYLYSKGLALDLPEINAIISHASMMGDSAFIQWLYNIGGQLKNEDIKDAARHGQLDVLKWASRHGADVKAILSFAKILTAEHINEWLKKG